MQETRLSVALATRNRAISLGRTLKSMRQQSVQPWEVIISDDSDDEQAAAVERLADVYNCRYLRGPRRGLYANRNRAAIACEGTHVRTMDDDHEFPPGHFERCLEAVASDSAAIWIIGEHLAADTDRTIPPQCPGQLHPRGFSTLPPNPDDCWALANGATIYPRTIFDAGHRFSVPALRPLRNRTELHVTLTGPQPYCSRSFVRPSGLAVFAGFCFVVMAVSFFLNSPDPLDVHSPEATWMPSLVGGEKVDCSHPEPKPRKPNRVRGIEWMRPHDVPFPHM